jgi:hypothetical protein
MHAAPIRLSANGISLVGVEMLGTAVDVVEEDRLWR